LPGAFEDVSFSIRAGEVMGFTGLLGDGRSELFRAIFGDLRWTAGSLLLDGKPIRIRGTNGALRHGLGYVPRNRKENGIVKDLSILHNTSLAVIGRLARPFISFRKERDLCGEALARLRVKMGAAADPILSLSGGNQQKVVLAKWLVANPRLMILDNPTQGVDVGAKEELYEAVSELADRGMAVAVLSSEAQEIVRLCGRAVVLYHGHVQGELPRERLSEENIMVLATGGQLQPAQ
jgi:ribose transport system ATP-binding protein